MAIIKEEKYSTNFPILSGTHYNLNKLANIIKLQAVLNYFERKKPLILIGNF